MKLRNWRFYPVRRTILDLPVLQMYGLRLDGKRCDIGNKEGFIKTNIDFALKRDDVAESLKEYIRELAKRI